VVTSLFSVKSIQDGPSKISSIVFVRILTRMILPLVARFDIRQLKTPSLRSASRSLYMQSVQQLEIATRPNLDSLLKNLVSDGEEVVVTDPKLPFQLRFIIKFREQ
jgi:NEDD8-activating enzyme E1